MELEAGRPYVPDWESEDRHGFVFTQRGAGSALSDVPNLIKKAGANQQPWRRFSLACVSYLLFGIWFHCAAGAVEWNVNDQPGRKGNRKYLSFPTQQTRAEMGNADSELRYSAVDMRRFNEQISLRLDDAAAAWKALQQRR